MFLFTVQSNFIHTNKWKGINQKVKVSYSLDHEDVNKDDPFLPVKYSDGENCVLVVQTGSVV